jgi:ubiquinone/menaquinone biosynthesis C-methylase UbiE
MLNPVDPYYQAQQIFLDRLRGMEWTTALEVGCGFGWHLKAIQPAFPGRRVAGLDFSFGQLLEARTFIADPSVGLWQASAVSLPHRDSAFDVVFTSGLLMCIHPDRVPDVMRELARVAKRHVVVLEPAREHIETPEQLAIMQTAAWHGHWFGPALEGAGLRVVDAFRFPSFASDPSRIPLSFFGTTKPQS